MSDKEELDVDEELSVSVTHSTGSSATNSLSGTPTLKTHPQKIKLLVAVYDNIDEFKKTLYVQDGKTKGNIKQLNKLEFIKPFKDISSHFKGLLSSNEIKGIDIDFDENTITFTEEFFEGSASDVIEARKSITREKSRALSADKRRKEAQAKEEVKVKISGFRNEVKGLEEENTELKLEVSKLKEQLQYLSLEGK